MLPLLPVFLYAETHYRIPFLPSLLKKREPELIADAPHRLDPHLPLPLLLLAKDSHLYPCVLESVRISIAQNGSTVLQMNALPLPVELREKLWWKVVPVNVDSLSGWIEVDVEFTITVAGRKKTYRNDNYRTSSHLPLNVYIAEDPLPRLPNLFFGDCHTHSNYTDDQVEFGAPLEPSITMARSMGLSFFCVTDHSYDLDDSPNNYLTNDPNLPKWKGLQEEARRLNAQSKEFVVLVGEEVSCRNRSGRNVHLLLIGNSEFIPGAGDSAERWFKTRSELSLGEVLGLASPDSFSAAAHPFEPVPIFQQLLLGRGRWEHEDLFDNNLDGIQFINGELTRGFSKGYADWINQLLQRRKLIAIAGTDAHGNFNRFRQLAIPFVRVAESAKQLFGSHRTGIFCPGNSAVELLQGLKTGAVIVTDGPVGAFYSDGPEEKTLVGRTVADTGTRLVIRAVSSREFGHIRQVRILGGLRDGSREVMLAQRAELNSYELTWTLESIQQPVGYVRMEIDTEENTSADGQPHSCLTNPVWLSPSG